MKKVDFGTKEVSAVVIAIVLYVIVEVVQRQLIGYEVISAELMDWVRLRILIVIVAAAIFGPIVGVLCGVGGAVLVNVIFYGYVSIGEVITYALCGYLMGRYYDKLAVLEGKFKGISLIDFNAIQVMDNIVCSILFVPLFLMMFDNMKLNDAIMLGFENAVGAIIMTALLGTPCLYLVGKLASVNSK